MKNLFKKMFADKIIGFKEGGNVFIEMMMKLPIFKTILTEEIYNKDKSKLRIIFSVLAQIGKCLMEFARKFIYMALFIYVPYLVLASACPNIYNSKEVTIIYMFIILCTFAGTLSNTILFTMSDRDFLMIRVMQISPYMNFLGKLVYKMLSDFVYFIILLLIFQVSLKDSIILSLVTMLLRPLGELIGIVCYDKAKKLHKSRGMINGLIMAASVIAAYLIPYINRGVSEDWYNVTGFLFVIISLAIGACSMYCLWYYKNYRSIMAEAMYIKRED